LLAAVLIVLLLLPLGIITAQLGLGTKTWIGYSLYKVAFLVPPVIYCRLCGIGLVRDILKLQNWRRGLGVAFFLGLLAIATFWIAYYVLGDLLLDKDRITARIDAQFHVNASTILLITPITILANSLLEEFFYRGFAYGQLARWHAGAAYLLPSLAFTLQHLLFIRDWVTFLPLMLAIAGLVVFAIILSWLYATYESIIAPWLTHIFGDVAMMGIALTLV